MQTGELEVDWEDGWFSSWEDECVGSFDLVDENPSGFLWNCCDQYADGEGCAVGPHVHVSRDQRLATIIDLIGDATSRHRSAAADQSTSSKRQRSSVCTICRDTFEVGRNNSRSCRHHKGTTHQLHLTFTPHVGICHLLTLQSYRYIGDQLD